MKKILILKYKKNDLKKFEKFFIRDKKGMNKYLS